MFVMRDGTAEHDPDLVRPVIPVHQAINYAFDHFRLQLDAVAEAMFFEGNSGLGMFGIIFCHDRSGYVTQNFRRPFKAALQKFVFQFRSHLFYYVNQ